MKSIPFLARGTKPAPLPDWVLNQLADGRQPSDPACAANPVKTLMYAALESSGLHESDLLEIILRETDYDPKSCMIYKALHGECEDAVFQKRINHILQVSDEQWAEANHFRKGFALGQMNFARYEECRSSARREYRKKDPYLRVLRSRVAWWSFSKQVGYVHHRDLSIDMHGVADFSPPSAEEMASMIAHYPESCHSDFFRNPYFQKEQLIGGYRYHRLPDEVHTYDAQGNIYASGGILAPNPPGTTS